METENTSKTSKEEFEKMARKAATNLLANLKDELGYKTPNDQKEIDRYTEIYVEMYNNYIS